MPTAQIKRGSSEGPLPAVEKKADSELYRQGRRLRLFFSDERMEKLEYVAKSGGDLEVLKCANRKSDVAVSFSWCGYSRAFAVVVLLAKAKQVERPKLFGGISNNAVATFLDNFWDRANNVFNNARLFGGVKLNQVFCGSNRKRGDVERWVVLDPKWLPHDCIEIYVEQKSGIKVITQNHELIALARQIEKQNRKWSTVSLEKPGREGQFVTALAQAKAGRGKAMAGEVFAKLDCSTSADMERDYVALARDGRYDSAASLGKKALGGAEAAEDKRLTAHWADRVADAYRAIGLLREASAFYAISWAKAQEALAQSPDDLKLRYQVGKTRFGQIMVDDYLVRGAFSEAYGRHAQLLSDVDSLLKDGVPDAWRPEILHRRIHIKRQQAEMLRYLGRYTEALKAIREVLSEYPASAHEPRSYARISEADSLRLQGDTKTASTIYAEVEATARERHLDGLLGAVLWRKACLLQLDDGDGQFDNCLKEVAQLANDHPQRYRFMVIYALLLRASGKITDVEIADAALRKVEKFGPLRVDYLVAEYAHAALCRGEIFRQSNLPLQASDSFETAFVSYTRMECRWGMVRAWIGLRLSGRDVDFPRNVKRTLEGTDAKLFQKFHRNREIQPGILSMNIP